MKKYFEAVLVGDHVALKVDAHVYRFAALRGFAAPDACIVFLKTGNILEALRFDPRPSLTFRKAIRSNDGAFGLGGLLGEFTAGVLASGLAGRAGCCCAKPGNATATSAAAIKVLRIDFSFFEGRSIKTMRGYHRSVRTVSASISSICRRNAYSQSFLFDTVGH